MSNSNLCKIVNCLVAKNRILSKKVCELEKK